MPPASGQPSPLGATFLTAEWRDLVMLNYEVHPGLLHQHVPPGTTLDSFDGKTLVSLVGFRFCRTRLFGSFAVPFHLNFDEVNLRFYVRRKVGDENRRGVVFIAEIVPRPAVAMLARLLYGENYVCLPMRHSVAADSSARTVQYSWKLQGQWCRLIAQTSGLAALPKSGSLEQFITEHYWGYSKQGASGSLEYHVTHEPWRVWASTTAAFEGDMAALYGPELAKVLQGTPDSAFIADGSPVTVFKGALLS
ncbi:MAG TPA: DUF2071 domain-containing protein [Candidatus Acidoferrales bacterium]|jgi:uncharacterized protein YqjF (DUF2071 family)|nr:DUF2071 domain-containing protein [Candidatus Acidoferrales bacterium]